MDERADQIRRFLADAGWSSAARTALAGDASSRRYERLSQSGETAILMDAPGPDGASDTFRFIRVGDWLRAQTYSAPAILRSDAEAGLLLLEDLGDALFARLCAQQESVENSLYSCATGFLSDLHRRRPPGFVPVAGGAQLAGLMDLAGAWLLPALGRSGQGIQPVKAAFVSLYPKFDDGPLALSLRDFHAENLIWLPDRNGIRRCGLLDFQDAFATHPAYDLVSLLQDARRDVAPSTEQAMLRRYLATSDAQPVTFRSMYALIGAQRSLRILGVFARLARAMGKPRYLDFVPRVWSNLQRNLDHPALGPLADAVHDAIPRLGADELSLMRTPWTIPDR